MTTTGNIITKTFGQNTYLFNVGEILTSKGSKKYVFVTQTTVWTKEDNEIFGFEMEDSVAKFRFYFDLSTTEFGAINLAGKKLINNWEKI
jgi:hypothetical protein